MEYLIFDDSGCIGNQIVFKFATLNYNEAISGEFEVAQLNFKTGAEVGTAKGDYAEQLCQGIPHLKLYCIDPWKVYKDYSDEPDQKIAIEISSYIEFAILARPEKLRLKSLVI